MKRITAFVFAVVAVSLWACAPVASQPDAPTPTMNSAPVQAVGAVNIPDVKVGDRWVYHYTDPWTDEVKYKLTEEVVAANSETIKIKRTRSNGNNTLFVITDREWRKIKEETEDGRWLTRYTPFYPSFAFPLEVGKTWKERVTTTYSNSSRQVVNNPQGGVVGWERITTPAGTFDTLKIKLDGNYLAWERSSWSGRTMATVWYSPKVKRWVRYEFEDTFDGHLYNRDRLELLEYKVD